MTEQEIIKYIKDEIENETDTYHWFDDTPKNKTRLQIEESINAHQGLLDLYINAKEEINKLNNVIDKMTEKIYKLKVKLEINDLLQDCFIPREFSDINDCTKKDCKECLKEYFMKEDK